MDDEFGLLVTRNLPCRVNGLLLRVLHGGCQLVASTLDGPAVLMRNNMLILPVMVEFLVEPTESRPPGRVANDCPL